MDKERRQKIQAIKLIVTESVMFIVIILTVIVLSFIVMGYHFNDDGELEQSGLVGVDSTPTGASVTIDGELLPAKTNTSKILSEGKHTVLVEKSGYTSWQKTVSIHSGFLTKLSYPRLYLLDRETKSIQTLAKTPTLYSISPLRNAIIYSEDSKTLKLLNLDSAEPKTSEIDLQKILNLKTLEDPKILEWNAHSTRLILSYKTPDLHYAVIDLEHPADSLDLTSTFNLNLADLHFLNDNGDKLFVLENSNLRTLSLNNKQASSVLAKHVLNFSNYGSRAVFVTAENTSSTSAETGTNAEDAAANESSAEETSQNAENTSAQKLIKLYDDSAGSIVTLATSAAENTRALVSEYLGRSTLVFLKNNLITIYRGDLPTSDVTPENPLPDPVGELALSFTPTGLIAKGQAIIASSFTPTDLTTKEQTTALSDVSTNSAAASTDPATLSVFDLETYDFSSYTLENSLTFWLDDYTIGVVSNGELLLRDFDGQNLLKFGPAESGFPAVIAKDNKYLYLVKKEQAKLNIVRETIK